MAPLGPESWRALNARYGHAHNSNESNSRAIVREFVTGTAKSRAFTDDMDNSSLIQLAVYFGWTENESFAFLVFPGSASPSDFAFVIENAASTWWNHLLRYIIPFDRLIFDIFLDSFQAMVTQTVVTGLFGPRRFSYMTWSEALTVTEAVQQAITYPTSLFWANRSDYPFTPLKLVIGGGAYGLLAKAIAVGQDISGVAFNAPIYDGSPVSAQSKYADGTRLSVWNTNMTSRGFNVFAGDSFQFTKEAKWVARPNWEWPQWKWPWESVSSAETFCMAVAACATDDRLVDVCHRTVGEEEFRRFFGMWKRPLINASARDGQSPVPDL
jgi:hypothetical protein